MKISNIGNIHIVSSNSKKELTDIFLRFQENYESPVYKDKVFSLKEYQSGNTVTCWDGFNIPDYIMERFKSGTFKDLTAAESYIVSHFRDIQAPYYIIASIDNDIETTNHELAHAMYYLNPNYKQEVDNIIIPHIYMMRSLKRFLIEVGYNYSNLLDEFNSYILFDKETLVEYNIWNIELSLLSSRLSKIFYKYLSTYSKNRLIAC